MVLGEDGVARVLLCLVVTGTSCLGHKDMALGSVKKRSDANSWAFTSAVDDLSNPEIFVVPDAPCATAAGTAAVLSTLQDLHPSGSLPLALASSVRAFAAAVQASYGSDGPAGAAAGAASAAGHQLTLDAVLMLC